jgi:TPR repeat protein
VADRVCGEMLARDHRRRAQFNYGILLLIGEGIEMNKSLAAYYFKLSSDQRFVQAQLHYGPLFAKGEDIAMNKSLAAHYFKLSADQGIAEAQFNYRCAYNCALAYNCATP